MTRKAPKLSKYKDGGKVVPKTTPEKTPENTMFPVGYDPKTGVHSAKIGENNAKLTTEQWMSINAAQGNVLDPRSTNKQYPTHLPKGWSYDVATNTSTGPEGMSGPAPGLDYNYKIPTPQPKVIPVANSGRTFLANDANGNTTYTNTDPNSQAYKVGQTYTLDKSGNPVGITQTFKDGGKVRKAPNRMYTDGTDITGIKKQPTQQELNARKGANAAGSALGGYGSGYYATQNADTDSENTRNAVLGSVSQMGAIGGAIGGIAAIGDKVGAPVKNRAEQTDENGNLIDPTKAKQTAVIGGLLSPSKALSYRADSGNWTDVTGQGYVDYLQGNAKKKIAEAKAVKDKEKFNVALDAANQERGFWKGGTIKGKGGPTDDAIKTTVGKKGIEEKSFIVPAKNNDAAKMLRATILGGDPNKVAQFKKEGGDAEKGEIAVSNGEHLFTPKEKNRIISKLGEEVLEDLAPEAESEETEKKKGGDLTAKKAKTILHDKEIRGHAITDKQRKFFGAIAGGAKPYANGTGIDGVEETMPERVARMKKEDEAKKNKQPYSASGATIMNNASGRKAPSKTGAKKTTVTVDTLPMKKQSLPTETMNQSLNDNEKLADYKIKNTEMKPETNYANAEKPKSGSSIWDKIGNIGEYGAAAAQIGIGAYNLNKTKRPIYSIDPDYGAALNNANQAAAQAKAQSQYGFDKNQQFLLDQENQNLTNQQRFDARNLSGGSAANAYNMERDAINEGFFRNLKGKVASNAFKMEKQGIAQDRQQYANQLLGGKIDMQRQIFQDAMNQFTAKQNTGSELVAAGLRNTINAKRYNDELNFQKEQNQLYPNI